MDPSNLKKEISARKGLPDWAKKAIELDAEGWTLTPIAKQLGVHKSTVYGVLVRARGKGKRKDRLNPPDGQSTP
jgi:transposase